MAMECIVCIFSLLIAFTQGQGILTGPGDATEIIEEEAKFQCEVEFGAKRVMTWEHNNHEIYAFEDDQKQQENEQKYTIKINENIFILTVHQLQFSDGGIYTCTGMNDKAEATLVVLGKPRIFDTTPSFEQMKLKYSCIAHFGGPDENHISASHFPRLAISSNIECMHPDDIPSLTIPLQDNKVYHLEYNREHILWEECYIPSALEKVEVTISCEIRTSNPKKSVMTDEQFTMPGINPSKKHPGSNKEAEEPDSHHGSIRGSIITPPRNLTGLIGQEAVFHCEIELGEIPVMSWTHNNEVIYSFKNEKSRYNESKYTMQQEGTNFTLTVHKLNYNDGGIYICRDIIYSAVAALIVLEQPKLFRLQPSQEEWTVTYSCVANFGGPSMDLTSPQQFPKIKMLVDGTILKGVDHKLKDSENNEHYVLRQDYEVTSNSKEDGKYLMCEVGTLNPSKSVSSMQMKVQKPDTGPPIRIEGTTHDGTPGNINATFPIVNFGIILGILILIIGLMFVLVLKKKEPKKKDAEERELLYQEVTKEALTKIECDADEIKMIVKKVTIAKDDSETKETKTKKSKTEGYNCCSGQCS